MPISLSNFLSGVKEGNLEFIAKQFNISIAEAELVAAKVFPDPEITVAYANNEDGKMQMGQSMDAGLSYTLNLGNPRKAGIGVAQTQLDISRLMIESYFRNLRADAAKGYFSALRNSRLYKLQSETWLLMKNLSDADSMRLRAGEVSELDAIQTSLDARLQYHVLLQSHTEMVNSLISLAVLQGQARKDSLFTPADDFPLFPERFTVAALLDSAMASRRELMIAVKGRELSEKTLNLLKAGRSFEFSIEAGYSYNSVVKNEIAPAPAHNSYSAGISIPLKFSNFNKGSISAAKNSILQNEINQRDVELKIYSEVLQAYNYYSASRGRMESFSQQLIENADRILKGRIHAYQAGESGLAEVINARRTYTDILTGYIESLYEYSIALIDLERSAGIWDIRF